MYSTQAQRPIQLRLRVFKVAVVTDAELVYSDGTMRGSLLAFDAWVYKGKTSTPSCDVLFDLTLCSKRKKLFQAGHRLVIKAWTDTVSPMLYATDAWFDRHRPG